MESIGERLKSAREAKKLTIRDVAKDTNISQLYIEALESENFDLFPGETYLLGFLRSYSEYLKLDAETILAAYRGYKIGESNTPLEELTKSTKQSLGTTSFSFLMKYKAVLIVVVIVIAFFGLYKGISSLKSADVNVNGGTSLDKIKSTVNTNNIGVNSVTSVQLSNDHGVIIVSQNEAVSFLVENKEVVFLLKEIKDNSVIVTVLPGQKTEELALDKPVTFNLQGTPREVKMTLKGLTENKGKLFVELGKSLVPENTDSSIERPDDNADNTSVVAVNKKNLKIVFQASFTEKSFVEIYLDGAQKYRGFINPGTNERWEASEFIQIKAGNAGGLKARINGRDYVFGKSGQVVNKMVTWKKDVSNPNLYHIVIKDQ